MKTSKSKTFEIDTEIGEISDWFFDQIKTSADMNEAFNPDQRIWTKHKYVLTITKIKNEKK